MVDEPFVHYLYPKCEGCIRFKEYVRRRKVPEGLMLYTGYSRAQEISNLCHTICGHCPSNMLIDVCTWLATMMSLSKLAVIAVH